mgnify:CR=1 FL=1
MIDAERWDGTGGTCGLWCYPGVFCRYYHSIGRVVRQWYIDEADMIVGDYLDECWPDTIAYADAGTEAE